MISFRQIATAAVTVSLLAACSKQPAPAPVASEAPSDEPSLTVNALPSGVHPGEAALQVCGRKLAVTLDEASFQAVGKPVDAARLAAIKDKAVVALMPALFIACDSVPGLKDKLATVEDLHIAAAAGAIQPTFFAAEVPPRTLVLQYVFAPGDNGDLAMPRVTGLVTGLRCWATPTDKACAARSE